MKNIFAIIIFFPIISFSQIEPSSFLAQKFKINKNYIDFNTIRYQLIGAKSEDPYFKIISKFDPLLVIDKENFTHFNFELKLNSIFEGIVFDKSFLCLLSIGDAMYIDQIIFIKKFPNNLLANNYFKKNTSLLSEKIGLQLNSGKLSLYNNENNQSSEFRVIDNFVLLKLSKSYYKDDKVSRNSLTFSRMYEDLPKKFIEIDNSNSFKGVVFGTNLSNLLKNGLIVKDSDGYISNDEKFQNWMGIESDFGTIFRTDKTKRFSSVTFLKEVNSSDDFDTYQIKMFELFGMANGIDLDFKELFEWYGKNIKISTLKKYTNKTPYFIINIHSLNYEDYLETNY